jgi:hypothetical protein
MQAPYRSLSKNCSKPAPLRNISTFIYYYTKIHGTPPAEADFRRFFQVTPPVVHQMIKTLVHRT